MYALIRGGVGGWKLREDLYEVYRVSTRSEQGTGSAAERLEGKCPLCVSDRLLEHIVVLWDDRERVA